MSVASNVGLFVALYVAIVRMSFVPFGVYAVALAALLWLRQRFVPLFPITDAVAAGERRLRMVSIVAFVALIAVGAVSSALWK